MTTTDLVATTDTDNRQMTRTHQAEMSVGRVAQEVQAAVTVAQARPRNQTEALRRIVEACHRKRLAESAMYAYKRGGALVTGPSIRLAEVMAQNWGNLDFGIQELEQSQGESLVMAYCWDLQTNTRQTKVFTVPHVRYTKSGTKKLEDPRDIYEVVANYGARRMRACILGIIPQDIQDEAIDACHKTLSGDSKEPMIDRVRRMVHAFSEHGVTQEMIERRLGHNLDATIEPELVTLRTIYQSLKDNMSSREEWFEGTASEKIAAATADDVNDLVG